MNSCLPIFAHRAAGRRLMMKIVSLLIHFAIARGVFHLSAAVPGITSQPVDASRLVGENVAFNVVVSNTTGAGYQWYLEDSPLSSRTNATLTLVGLSTNSAGHFSVVITNMDGATTSRVASLTVTQPNFGQQSVPSLINMISYRGQNGLLVNVTVTGATNGGNIWGTDIYTDDSSLALAAVHAGYLSNGEVGTLTVKVLPGQSSYTGTIRNGVTSASYGQWIGSYQIVGLAPTFTVKPFSHVAWTGGSVVFSAQATAGDSLFYQWKHNGSELNGQTNSFLTLSNLTAVDAGSYAVMAWTTQGTNSEIVTLVVIDPTPGLPPISAPYYANGLSYLDGEVYRLVITGTTNSGSLYGSGIYSLDSVLSLAAVHSGLLSPGEQGTLAVLLLPTQSQFIGSSQNGVSSMARANPAPAFGFLALTPTITRDPRAQGALFGGSAAFSVAATSRTMPLRYQWRRNGGDLLDKTNATLSLSNLTSVDGGQYDAVVSNPEGSTVSLPAPLAVLSAVTIPQTGNSVCGATNGAIVFATVVGNTNGGLWGDSVYTCDSTLATAAVHAGLLASGQTGAVAVVSLPGQSQYYSTTRNGVTSAAYGAFFGSYAFIGLAPYINGQPQPQNVNVGDTVTFSVTATSSAPLNYHWQKGDVPIPGQNSDTLIISNVASNDMAQYSVVVSNQLGYAISAPATLTVTAGASVQLTLAAPGLLNLHGDTGVTWQVQSRDSIATGAWLPLSNVFLDISPKSLIDPNSLSKSNRFYRAQKIP